ncbi:MULTISPECIES: hypothetical protein [unclassified Mucilaginibacter]|uniref:hypothetical protein n=1 Tax=unclassified Mucilaginibacter TaxID=2617802 RepID=UPI0031F65133
MKHAFIFATNVFISGERTISYATEDQKIEFLKILSFYEHHSNNTPDKVLRIDAQIGTSDGVNFNIQDNQLDAGTNTEARISDKRIQLFRPGHEEPVLDVRQLDEDEYKELSSHIVNEIDAQHAYPVLMVRGDFSVNGHRIVIDNDKLFVNGDDFANGVTNAHEGVILRPNDSAY